MKPLNRRDFMRNSALAMPLLLTGFHAVSGETAAAAPRRRPNILFLFADDQCHEALGCLGAEVKTPNLDRLAARGVNFTHAYNQGGWHGAICVASRTMLLTGRQLWHAAALEPKLNDEIAARRFWPQLLQDGAGYDTWMAGKWHIQAPVEKAFMTTRHIRPGMAPDKKLDYNRPLDGKPDTWNPWDEEMGGHWTGGKHWSEVLGDDGVDFIGQAAKRDKPFFMYLAFNAPHDPRQSPKRYVDLYPADQVKVPENFLPEYPDKDGIGCDKSLRDEALAPFPRTRHAIQVHRQEYFAIITHMDDQIGRILDALEKSGQAENTVIIFAADNGLAIGQHGLMGKQSLFEHSIGIPLIIAGAGIPQGKRIEAPVYLQDIMPTSLELAGIPVPAQVEFNSLLPLIRGEQAALHESIYGAYMNLQRMVHKGDYKLIVYPKLGKTLLFNVKTDPLETIDLAGRPESAPILAELQLELLRLQRTGNDPLLLPKAKQPKAKVAPAH
jgi:choline-sulfatase